MSASNHFALFGLSPTFELDLNDLAARYRELVREVHPDRFASATEQAQRQALEHSANLNEAYQTLKQATLRARYLLHLQGHELAQEMTVQDPEFLMQQMHWREELEQLRESGGVACVAAFAAELERSRHALETAFAACWADSAQVEQAKQLAYRMQFLDKLFQELRQLQEQLDD